MNKRHKLIRFLIAFCIVFFLIYQYYVGFYSTITTESASQYEYTEGIDGQATVIRSEKTITSSKEGTIHFMVASGEKIAKDGTIANIYSSDSASAAATRILEIDKQLSIIEEIEGYNDLTAVDMDTINARINSHLNSFVLSTQDGRFYDTADSLSDLLTMMTRKQVATGEQTDFSSLKQSLLAEKDELSAQMGNPKGSITAEMSGYFVSNADGFETLLTSGDLSVYTPEYLKKLSNTEVSGEVIGKIVYDYEWYLAVPVTLNESMYYKTGEAVSVKIDAASSTVLTAIVEKVNLSESEDSAVIILRCNEMNSELATLRTASVTLIKAEHSGIKIPAKALRVIDGKTGVFVVSGLEAKFVETDIIYSNDDYALSKLNTAESDKLRLYDEIIVKGKNLYDGKIIY